MGSRMNWSRKVWFETFGLMTPARFVGMSIPHLVQAVENIGAGEGNRTLVFSLEVGNLVVI
jgi:hypothetical protein